MAGARFDRASVLRVGGVALIGLLALLHVPFPFDHDQGLFMSGARAIAGGAKLYVDFWDMKQPGIYWYYLAAGEAFGFDEVGLHLLDLLWTLALGWILIRIAARTLRSQLLIALMPLICLGPFYAATSPWHLSQVEIIVALPLAATVAVLLDTGFDDRRLAARCAVAGALGALVIVLKAMLAVIPAAMILLALWDARRLAQASPRDVIVRGLVPALLGAAAALLPAIFYLWDTGTLGDAMWTLLTYPRLAVAEYPVAPPWRLRLGIEWFVHASWVLLPFALLGAWHDLRRGSRMAMFALLWLVGSGLETLVQTLSWWEYHFDLFFVPTGLLAARGFDLLASGDVLRGPQLRRGVFAAGLVALVATIAVPIARKTSIVLASPSPFASRTAVMLRIDHGFETVIEEEHLLDDPHALPGDIAVLGGDGRLMLYAHRPILWKVNGAAHFLAWQVREEADAIEKDRPAYIYLAPHSRYLYTHGTDEIERYVASHYVARLHDVRDGVWYERNDGIAAGVPGAGPSEHRTR
jgi:hypothetical protein